MLIRSPSSIRANQPSVSRVVITRARRSKQEPHIATRADTAPMSVSACYGGDNLVLSYGLVLCATRPAINKKNRTYILFAVASHAIFVEFFFISAARTMSMVHRYTSTLLKNRIVVQPETSRTYGI